MDLISYFLRRINPGESDSDRLVESRKSLKRQLGSECEWPRDRPEASDDANEEVQRLGHC